MRAQQDEFLERHANGETITRIMREMHIATSSPWRWNDADPRGFGIRYARAREGCSAQNHRPNHRLGAPPEKVYEALADVIAKDPLFAAGMDLRLP